MQSFSILKKSILLAIILFPAFVVAQSKGGKKLYEQYCLTCHQADGSGVPQMNPPLQQTTYVNGDVPTLIGIVLNGLNEEIEVNGETYANAMPSFSGVLNDQQIGDILTYVRSNFKNTSGPVTAAQVKKERAKKKVSK